MYGVWMKMKHEIFSRLFRLHDYVWMGVVWGLEDYVTMSKLLRFSTASRCFQKAIISNFSTWPIRPPLQSDKQQYAL